MIDTILSAIPNGNKRHPLMFYRLLDTLRERLELAKNKFIASSLPRTSGVEILRWMLLNFDLDTAESFLDDASLFTEYTQNYQDEFRNVFDPVWTKTLSSGKFIRTRGKIYPAEILLNCSRQNPAVEFPFDKGWEEWKYVRAVKILYHDSLELPIDMYTGYVTFANKSPGFVVIALDVSALLMKWVKYNQYCKSTKEEPDEVEFLKQSEFEQFFDDLFDIWTTNLILSVVEHPEASVDKICSEVSIPGFLTTANIIKNGISALKEQIGFVHSRSVRLQDFLDTSWYSDMSSIRDRILEVESYLLPETRMYQWLVATKLAPYLKMLAALFSQDPDNPQYRVLMKKAYWIYIKQIKFANLPSMQYMPALKTYIGLACKTFESLFCDKIETPVEDTL